MSYGFNSHRHNVILNIKMSFYKITTKRRRYLAALLTSKQEPGMFEGGVRYDGLPEFLDGGRLEPLSSQSLSVPLAEK